MATSKKSTPAAKRKAAAPKKAAAKAPAAAASAPAVKSPTASVQAMDIIPKSRVRPTTTSRPVITASTPAVADNTLTTPSGAPSLQIKRRKITINPPADSELNKEDVLSSLGAGPTEAASETPASSDTAVPAEQGVSVSDLIAKRKEKVVLTPPSEAADEEPAATEVPVAAESSVPESSETPGTTPELPAAEVDDPAAAEAARLLSDEADQPEATAVASAPEDAAAPAEQSEESVSEPEAVEPVAAEAPAATEEPAPEPKEEPTTEVAKDETPAADQPQPAETADAKGPASVEEVLEDGPEPAQEHSPALKEEIKNLDEKGVQSHHELYGGQPVIVVHKERGPMSALAWVLWFFVCFALALLVVNFLLDAGFIETTYRIPHTNIL